MIIESPIGRYFEEFEPGQVYRHAVTRTVTETDNLLFTALTHNTQPLHLDVEFSRGQMHGTRLVNSIFTLGLVSGVGVGELTLGTTFGNLGFGEIEFPHPVRIGDTIRAETEIVSKRESRSRPNAGIVEFEMRGFNQEEKLVVRACRKALMKRKTSETGQSGATA
ncbi:MaoC family dehydratase [Nitratireductor sp. XY-223]|uniref:MaoC family dehydratase n=1 Tax=Nitratireductor sp. XY-223 TaxID=2561926 RepID=UPI0010AB432E|nr:MaoC family dehydratase [Nitratireductor sp. XY-223]